MELQPLRHGHGSARPRRKVLDTGLPPLRAGTAVMVPMAAVFMVAVVPWHVV
jgi:hypothetical protein